MSLAIALMRSAPLDCVSYLSGCHPVGKKHDTPEYNIQDRREKSMLRVFGYMMWRRLGLG